LVKVIPLAISTRSLPIVSAIALCVAGLVASAPMAAAQAPRGTEVGAPGQGLACDRQVCEEVVFFPPPALEVRATATPFSLRCGHFVMTVSTQTGVIVRNSPRICSFRPTYTFARVPIRNPSGVTVAMQFVSSPRTPGRPIIRL
jgi:hypothetical protein